MVYNTFNCFMRSIVIPLKQKHPHDLRLDGQHSGGNRSVAGVFLYRGKRWKVHYDTHFAPLDQANDAWRNGDHHPFVKKPTPKGNFCLELKSQPRPKHLYIYAR